MPPLPAPWLSSPLKRRLLALVEAGVSRLPSPSGGAGLDVAELLCCEVTPEDDPRLLHRVEQAERELDAWAARVA